MKIKAAVVREINRLEIETVELAPPQANELLIRIKAAGVCHSDLHALRGELRPRPPVVLGHEGAGLVEAAGASVTAFKPGDHVLVNWLPACGACPMCWSGQPYLCERLGTTTFQGQLPDGTTRLTTEDGTPLKHLLSSATMAEFAVIDQAGAIRIPDDVPFEVAAIAGCAVITGVGAVVNTAQVRPGSSAAIIGCGGVGLSAILGCQLVGCQTIIAVDVVAEKLEFARQIGATDTINARVEDPVKALRSRTNGGPEYVFDAVGSPATIAQALKAVRAGGAAVIAGLHAAEAEASIPAGAVVMQNKRLLGSFAGSSRPHLDLPRLLALYRTGKLPIDRLVTRRYQLAELPEAFAAMEAGQATRGVIMFD